MRPPSATPWCSARVQEDRQHDRSHARSDEEDVTVAVGDAEDEGDALALIALFLNTLKGMEYKLLRRAVPHNRASRGIRIALSAFAGRKLMGFSYFRECHGHTLKIETSFI